MRPALTLRAFLLLLLEKVGMAAGAAFVVVLYGTAPGVHTSGNYAGAAWAALYAALVALVTGVISVGLSLKLSGLEDGVLRIVLQFLQVFAGVAFAAATGDIRHVPWSAALKAAIGATVPTILKVLAAAKSTNTPGASVIPFPRLEGATGRSAAA